MSQLDKIKTILNIMYNEELQPLIEEWLTYQNHYAL